MITPQVRSYHSERNPDSYNLANPVPEGLPSTPSRGWGNGLKPPLLQAHSWAPSWLQWRMKLGGETI